MYESKNKNIPNLAIGLEDFAGTGFFDREYLVASHKYRNTKLSLGLGWGKFTGINEYKNPLAVLSDSFNFRPVISETFNQGGSPSFDKWFRGSAGIFGGIEYFPKVAKGLSIKLEYDPYDYIDFSARGSPGISLPLRKKESNLNFGINIPIKDFLTISAS